jgi:T6SS, Phospholipase effector Tle1-like, catalytic domain
MPPCRYAGDPAAFCQIAGRRGSCAGWTIAPALAGGERGADGARVAGPRLPTEGAAPYMEKDIIICSDGTGNTFDGDITNVTRLVKHLDLDHPEQQVVRYDQGVGTTARGKREVSRIPASPGQVMPCVSCRRQSRAGFRCGPGCAAQVGCASGGGSRRTCARCTAGRRNYMGVPTTRSFCLGSAGARSRCGHSRAAAPMPLAKTRRPASIDESFDRAWRLFEPMTTCRGRSGPCALITAPAVHFIGLWDAVKSYCGLSPVILPHLRHNPRRGSARQRPRRGHDPPGPR